MGKRKSKRQIVDALPHEVSLPSFSEHEAVTLTHCVQIVEHLETAAKAARMNLPLVVQTAVTKLQNEMNSLEAHLAESSNN